MGIGNSYPLVRHITTRRERHGWIVFSFGVEKYNGKDWTDLEVLHRCWVDPDDMSRVRYTMPADYEHRTTK